jgi:hypothetical protein
LSTPHLHSNTIKPIQPSQVTDIVLKKHPKHVFTNTTILNTTFPLISLSAHAHITPNTGNRQPDESELLTQRIFMSCQTTFTKEFIQSSHIQVQVNDDESDIDFFLLKKEEKKSF